MTRNERTKTARRCPSRWSPRATAAWSRDRPGRPPSVGGRTSLGNQLGQLDRVDRVDRVVLVTGGPDVEGMFVLGSVVPASGQPPGPTAGGLELAEVQSPNLVRSAGLGSERGLASLSEPTPLPLILRGQDQPLVTQDTQHTRLGEHVPVMADHRPDLPVPHAG